MFTGRCTLKNVQLLWVMFSGSVLNIKGCLNGKTCWPQERRSGGQRHGLDIQVTLNLLPNPSEP